MYISASNPKVKTKLQATNDQPTKVTAYLRSALGALFIAFLLLPSQQARAECIAEMGNINFGDINPLTTSTVEGQGHVIVTCTKTTTDNQPQRFNVCITADGGQTQQGQLTPRRLCKDGNCATGLITYNLFTSADHQQILGPTNGSVGSNINRIITVQPPVSNSISVPIPIYAKLTLPQTNATAGNYRINFGRGSTAMAFFTTTADTPSSCTFTRRDKRFPFDVTASVINSCTINEVNDLHFGNILSTASNLQGQSSFGVACTKNTPYKIGLLLPDNNNNPNGQGIMRSTQTGNSDTIAYQLRSSAGMNGAIWGNTATATNIGNGVAGTGTGATQTHHVYATIGNLGNVRADDYRDKVIINVNY